MKTKKLLGIVTTTNKIHIRVNGDGVNQFHVLMLRNFHLVSHRDLTHCHTYFLSYILLTMSGIKFLCNGDD